MPRYVHSTFTTVNFLDNFQISKIPRLSDDPGQNAYLDKLFVHYILYS